MWIVWPGTAHPKVSGTCHPLKNLKGCNGCGGTQIISHLGQRLRTAAVCVHWHRSEGKSEPKPLWVVFFYSTTHTHSHSSALRAVWDWTQNRQNDKKSGIWPIIAVLCHWNMQLLHQKRCSARLCISSAHTVLHFGIETQPPAAARWREMFSLWTKNPSGQFWQQKNEVGWRRWIIPDLMHTSLSDIENQPISDFCFVNKTGGLELLQLAADLSSKLITRVVIRVWSELKDVYVKRTTDQKVFLRNRR